MKITMIPELLPLTDDVKKELKLHEESKSHESAKQDEIEMVQSSSFKDFYRFNYKNQFYLKSAMPNNEFIKQSRGIIEELICDKIKQRDALSELGK